MQKAYVIEKNNSRSSVIFLQVESSPEVFFIQPTFCIKAPKDDRFDHLREFRICTLIRMFRYDQKP